MQPIVLYDTPSNNGKAWNTVCIRMRLCLGFKGLPYKTEWVEYPDLEPTLRSINAAPTGTRPDTGNPFYTVPVILDPNNITAEGKPTVVSDSYNIAMYLDEHYPTDSQLVPKETAALQTIFQEYFLTTVILPIVPSYIYRLYQVLNEESKPYFRQTREIFFKTRLEEFCPEDSAEREEVWERGRKGFSQLASWLDSNSTNKNGPYFTGSSPCFVDFVIAAFLDTIVRFTPEDWEKRVTQWDAGRWKALREACAHWLQSSDA